MGKNNNSPLFKVYYSDLSTFSAYTLEDVGRTPVYEVLLIVEKDDAHGRKLVSGGDYYVWESENKKWLSCDGETRNMYMAREGLEKRYLIGAMVNHEKWTKAVIMAREDPDFKPQTALHRYETKEGFE